MRHYRSYRAGIPTFIISHFLLSSQAAKNILEMARQFGTPVTSYSSIRPIVLRHKEDMREANVGEYGKIKSVTLLCKADYYKFHYGGFFFMVLHMVEPLIYMFDEKIIPLVQ